MDRGNPARGARLGVVGFVATGALGGVAVAVAASTGSFVAAGAAAHLLVGGWVWLGILLLERRRARAEADRLEIERLTALRDEGRRSLFDPAQGETDASQATARFERIGTPLLTVALAATEGLAAFVLFTRFPLETPKPTLVGAATLCGLAFVFLLLGRYAFALSAQGLPSAAGAGRRATSSSFALLLAGLALAAGHALELQQADAMGYLFVGVEALLALEALVLLLLEVYRPRRPGEVSRPPYDSRLLGLLSAPSDLAQTIAHAVDYQFGFALSQTWFYRFLERWVAPLCLFTALTFWLLSTLVVVGPHEQAIVRRLGSPLAPPLGPGIHLKLPWPLDLVQPVATGRLHTALTGHENADEKVPAVLVWTTGGHEGESLVLLARASDDAGVTPVNLLAAAASVHYRITDLDAYVTHVADPHAVLSLLAERELSFLLSGADLDLLLRNRTERADDLARRLQASADRLGLGLRVHQTALADLHPPLAVGRAFEDVTVALERRHKGILDAEVYAAERLPRARSEAETIRRDARVEAYRREVLAEADANRFARVLEIYRASPELWRTARLLERVAEVARDKRTFVLGRTGTVLTELDLQEKVSAEELGIGQSVFSPDAERQEEGK